MSTVNLELTRIGGKYHFQTMDAQGHTVETDASEAIGGTNKGMRPMEMFLASMISCSCIDIVLILEKQRQKLEDLKVKVSGLREKVEQHSEYKKIHLEFHFYGQVKESKAKRAIDLSLEKYCSVSLYLKQTATFSYAIIIHENSDQDGKGTDI